MIAPFVAADPAGRVVWDRISSPIWELILTGAVPADKNPAGPGDEPGAGSRTVLTGLFMVGSRSGDPYIPAGAERDPGALAEVTGQLGEYFAGERRDFDVPLAPEGSPFQQEVWAALTRIPYGRTASYGDIAVQVTRTVAASRAIGAANGQNPIAVIIPCHRVISADGGLGGYGGGRRRKEILLRLEDTDVMAARDATLW